MNALDQRDVPTQVLSQPGRWSRFSRKWDLLDRVRRQVGWPVVIIAVGLLAVAIFANVLSPAHPQASSLSERLVPPFSQSSHVLGTDAVGRDVLSRLMYGSRISLLVGFSAVFAGVAIGTALGLVSGYFGGWVDAIVMRVADAQLGMPSLVLALAIMSVLGAGVLNVVIALSIGGWVRYARVVRSSVLALRNAEYAVAAQSIGCPPRRVLVRHLLPNVITPVIILATLGLGYAILAESSLSFLGLGVSPGTPSWGSMLADGRTYLATAWWVAALPGLAIMLTVLVTNLIGDALRDQLDPKMMQR